MPERPQRPPIGRILVALMVIVAIMGPVAGPVPAYAVEGGEFEPPICELYRKVNDGRLDDISLSLTLVDPMEKICREGYWGRMTARPLEEFLSPVERSNYDDALGNSDCDAAISIVRRPFALAHPEAPSIEVYAAHFHSWLKFAVPTHFPRLFICYTLREIWQAQVRIEKEGLDAPPFVSLAKSLPLNPDPPLHLAVVTRNGAVFRLLLGLTASKSPDVALELLKLSVDGRTLKLHPINESWMAARLRRHGFSDPVISIVQSRSGDIRERASIASQAYRGTAFGVPHYDE